MILPKYQGVKEFHVLARIGYCKVTDKISQNMAQTSIFPTITHLIDDC